jgi:hypothetical protein
MNKAADNNGTFHIFHYDSVLTGFGWEPVAETTSAKWLKFASHEEAMDYLEMAGLEDDVCVCTVADL